MEGEVMKTHGLWGWGLALCLAALSAAGSASGQALGKTVHVDAQDEFSDIDNQRSMALIARFKSPDPRVQEAAIDEAMADPNAYVPPILFEISAVLYDRKQPEEATYWYALARLRAVKDSEILLDKTAASGIGQLVQVYGKGFRDYMPAHMDEVLKQMTRAVEWDRAHPPAYDRRWLALHGMRAIDSGLAAKEGRAREREAITVPEKEWAAMDEEIRVDMVEKIKGHMKR